MGYANIRALAYLLERTPDESFAPSLAIRMVIRRAREDVTAPTPASFPATKLSAILQCALGASIPTVVLQPSALASGTMTQGVAWRG